MTKLIDSAALEQFVQDDRDMLEDLAALFAELLPQDLERMQRAADSRDTDSLQEFARRMQGRFDCFCCPSLVALAEQLEEDLRSDSLDNTDHLVESIRSGALELTAELRQIVSTDKHTDNL